MSSFDGKEVRQASWIRYRGICDLRIVNAYTFNAKPFTRTHLDEFAKLYKPSICYDRKTTWAAEADEIAGTGSEARWRVRNYDELIARDKASVDIFWLKDQSLADTDNLLPPEVIAQEIVENLEAALEQFRLTAADMGDQGSDPT